MSIIYQSAYHVKTNRYSKLTMTKYTVVLAVILLASQARSRQLQGATMVANEFGLHIHNDIDGRSLLENTPQHDHHPRRRRLDEMDYIDVRFEKSDVSTGLINKVFHRSVHSRRDSQSRFLGESDAGDSLVMLQHDDSITGSIVDVESGMVYQIRPDAQGVSRVFSQPSSSFPPEADALYDIGPAKKQHNVTIDDNEDSVLPKPKSGYKSVIDVMVVWTEQAECEYAGLEVNCNMTQQSATNMRALIDLAVLETNVAFANSGIDAELRLMHKYKLTNYTEKQSTEALNYLSSDSNVQRARMRYGADAVMMIYSKDTVCGRGFLAYPTPLKYAMFAVITWNCATGNFSFGHELGHILGCSHDRGGTNKCDVTNSTAFGYRDPNEGAFRDIMATDCKRNQCDNNPVDTCTRVQRFSNNKISFNGRPIGNAMNSCADHINSVAEIAANYYFPMMAVEPPINRAPTISPVQVVSTPTTATLAPVYIPSRIVHRPNFQIKERKSPTLFLDASDQPSDQPSIEYTSTELDSPTLLPTHD